ARELVDSTAYCFEASRDRPGSGNICLTDTGVPLSESIQFGLWGPAEIHAKAVLQLPPVETLRRLPWDTSTQGAAPTKVAASQLEMPHLPLLDQYLATP